MMLLLPVVELNAIDMKSIELGDLGCGYIRWLIGVGGYETIAGIFGPGG